MKNQTRKIAVIGAGRWGRNIIRTLYSMDCLAGIAEQKAEINSTLKDAYPATTVYTDYNELLASDVDAVVIATPVVTHFDVAKAALLAGKDVLVEKPMTMDEREGNELVRIAKQNDLILMVGHMLLYQPAIQFIKKFITQGQLGDLISLRQVRRNLGTIRTQENVLYSLGVHDLAVLQYLVDADIVDAQHVGQSVITPGIEDDMNLHLIFANNVQAHLHVCWLWPVKDRHLMIIGKKGALHYDELAHEVTFHKNHGNADATVTSGGSEIIFSGDTQPLRLELEHFLDSIVTRKAPLSPGEQGVAVVRLVQRIGHERKQMQAKSEEALVCA